MQLEKGISLKMIRCVQLEENMAVFDFKLSVEDIKQLEMLDKGKSLFGWYS